MFAANLIRAIFLALLLCSASAFAQRVTLTKDIPLREEPRFDSVAHASEQKGAIGKVLARNGPWYHVQVNGKKGWVLITDIWFTRDENLHASRQTVRVATVPLGAGHCFPERDLTASKMSEKQLALLDSYAVPPELAARPDEPLPMIAPGCRRE